jgi:hypothetical protein
VAKISVGSGRHIQQSTNSGSGKNGRNGNGNGSGEATTETGSTAAALVAAKISNNEDNCGNVGKNDDGDSGH